MNYLFKHYSKIKLFIIFLSLFITISCANEQSGSNSQETINDNTQENNPVEIKNYGLEIWMHDFPLKNFDVEKVIVEIIEWNEPPL